jgi:hypothetical protein
LGVAIAYFYKLCVGKLAGIKSYLGLSSLEVNIFAHIHWLLGCGFLGLGSLSNPSSMGGIMGVGLAITLSIYAVAEGRRNNSDPFPESSKEGWIYAGIAIAILGIFYQFAYATPNPWFNQNILIPYSAAIAILPSTLFFLAPWSKWGWNRQPWHRAGLILPLIIFAFIFSYVIATPCLLLVAIFYSIRAYNSRQIRLTYLSILFIDWAACRYIFQIPYFQIFNYALVICLSVIYISHTEPSLINPNSRNLRHNLRTIASGSLCIIAFFYTDTLMIFVTLGLSLGLAILGLAIQVRAYLFIGTLTLIALVLNQAVLLVLRYGFLLWAIGILTGISFMMIAANFEVRRDRILAIVRNIGNELNTWA